MFFLGDIFCQFVFFFFTQNFVNVRYLDSLDKKKKDT